MNTSLESPRILTRSIAALVAAFAIESGARAADGTWNVDASTNWSTAASWAGSTIADGLGFTANLRFNITATRTVTLDTARTIGNLVFEDLTTVSNDWALAGTSILTLDVAAGTSGITVTNRTATISLPLAGLDGVTTAGAGTLILSGANTWTGGLTLSGATIVQLNNNTAASTNAISYAAAATGRLVVNGGITIGNTINIGAGITNVAGRGLIEASDANGRATVNGPINITAGPTNGGMLRGGLTVGNELVIGGIITSSVQVTQRDGRVMYNGGGTGYTSLGVTGTAIVGANNGISTAATAQVALSGAGTLDLGTFNQSLAGLIFAATATGTVTGTTGTLTMTGNVSSSGNFTHVLNGNVSLGGATRNFTVNDGTNEVDLQAGATFASGTINKLGAGTLTLNGTSGATANVTATAGAIGGTGTVGGTVTVNAGTALAPATSITTGTFTAGTLAFGAGASTVRMKIGSGDLINSTTLTTAGGTTTFNLNQLGGILGNGTYPLINYTGASPGLGGFALAPVGHATAALVDTGTAIALNVTANDRVIWDGPNAPQNWATGATGNWKLESNAAVTNYIEADEVIFPTAPFSPAVTVPANVSPSKVRFENSGATTYTLTGAGGIVGATGLSVTNGGTVILRTPNSYSGATSLTNNSTLEVDFDTGSLTGTSSVSVPAGSTLKLTRDDNTFTFNRNITGAGTVIVDPKSAAAAAVRDTLTISGNNSGFSGQWIFTGTNGAGTANGSYRTNPQVTSANLGTAAVQVDAGPQVWLATNQTFTNNFTLAGAGFSETAGNTAIGPAAATTGGVYLGAGTALFSYGGIGALRIDTGTTLSGLITTNGNAKLGAHAATATLSGAIISNNVSDWLVLGGGSGSHTFIVTGTANPANLLVNGGSGTSAVAQVLQVGNNGSLGTVNTPEIVLYGNSAATAQIRYNRADGYTMPAGQKITAAAGVTADLLRTQVVINTTGTGFDTNGNTIDLSDGTNGGILAVGGTNNANAGVAGSILNLTGASVVDVGNFFVGDQTNISGTVNHSGTASATFNGQMRIGHWPTETGNYNISGGSLTAAGAPTQFPFQTTGTQETNGGIYLGIDGQGNLTQSGTSVVSTNFIVVDNRASTGGGANMATGIDTYTLNAGTLILKNAFGIISRNATASVVLNGGTIQAAAGVSPNLDSDKITVNNTVTLDTNGANNFNLYGALIGSGTLAVTGPGMLVMQNGTGGTLNAVGGGMPGGSMGSNSPSLSIAAGSTVQENRTGTNIWAGGVSGAGTLSKINTGYLAIRGSGSGFTGTINVNSGRLDLTSSFVPTTIALADGTSLAGEPTTTNLTLGTATGSTLYIDPNTNGAITTTNLTLNGVTTLDFASAPTGGTPWRAIIYTNKAGAGTVAVANAGAYRVAPILDDDGSRIAVAITDTRAQTWTGSASGIWDSGATANTNWVGPDNFFAGDTVTFDGTSGVNNVAIASGVSPWKTTVNSNTTNYNFTSTGSGIAGPADLEKSGTSTLTLSGANSYSGRTILNGGSIDMTGTSSAPLGNSTTTNTIVFNGGRLNTGAPVDLGIARSIFVDAGGGTFGGIGPVSLTIPGNLSGTGNLTFTSGVAQAPTYILSGNNSGFSGNVNVDSTGVTAGAATLRLAHNNALVAGTVNLAQSTVAGAATTLDLVNVTIGSGVTLQMNSNSASNFRTTLSNSSGYGQWNGPVQLFGTGLTQFTSTGSMILNGNVTDGGGFTGTMFIRGGGVGAINGTINLPTGFVSKTDASVWTINSTGNVWLTTGVLSSGSVRLGIANALPIGALLSIGQASDANASLLEMNGFNQQVNGLTWIPGNANSGRAVGNSSATQAILDLSSSTDYVYGASTGITGGNITGNITLIKNGSNTQTLAGPANTYTGNVTVNSGTLVAGGIATSTALGNPTVAGRTVTVNGPGTLSFTTNNVFGSGVGNANLPAVTVSGVLTSTRYNVLGNLTLLGGTLTQAATDAGSYEGYQFRGTVGVAVAASTIATTNGKANHLGPNTVFTVANATGDANTDLTVSTILRNQSGDFGLAAGALTKSGAGTMALTAANTFTGGVTINDGILNVNADAALGASAGAVAISNNAVLQASGAVTTTARTVTLGTGGGKIDTNGSDVTLNAGSTVTGTTLTKIGAGKLVLAGTQTYATLDTEAGRTDLASALGTGTSAIIANAETNISVGQTLASLTIGNAAVVTFGAPLPPAPGGAGEAPGFAPDPGGGDLAGVPVQGVPEPGSAALIFGGMLTLLGLHRRR